MTATYIADMETELNAAIDAANDLADQFSNRKPEGPGIFKKGDQVYKVQVSRTSGNLYAKSFNGTAFIYESGAIYALRETDRLTYEQAVAFGHETGICAMCGLELTDPESIEAGIGPVCEANWYGKGHRTARRQAKKAAAKAAAAAELPPALSPDEFLNLFA